MDRWRVHPALRLFSPAKCRSPFHIVSFGLPASLQFLLRKYVLGYIRRIWYRRHRSRPTTAMKANTSRARDPSWAHQKQKLRRDGTMLRFKLGAPAPHLLGIVHRDPTVSLQSSFIAEHVAPFSTFEEAPPHHSDEGDDQDARLWICNKKTPTLANTCLGGLRGDPFDTFPIPNRGHVPGAFDYCLSNSPFLAKH
jgi:hypothetical protein